MTARSWIVGYAAAIAIAGCGGGSHSATGAATGVADNPAAVPMGYRHVANARGGFTLAAPRRWAVIRHGETTILRAPGGAAAMSIAADRSGPALLGSLGDYARATLLALPVYRGLRVHAPTPLVGQHYA